jgi:hypothetical protein
MGNIGRDCSEDLTVDGRITLIWILWKGVDWIRMARVNKWRALAFTVPPRLLMTDSR